LEIGKPQTLHPYRVCEALVITTSFSSTVSYRPASASSKYFLADSSETFNSLITSANARRIVFRLTADMSLS
jgi:hypothetical protein